jgi:hypothetical protein
MLIHYNGRATEKLSRYISLSDSAEFSKALFQNVQQRRTVTNMGISPH